MRKKLIVIVGTNASGKSALAVTLAKRYRGEVVSADSRQIYKGLDLGSGKVPRDRISNYQLPISNYYHQGIPHHLLDVASPKRTFTAAHYQRRAIRAIASIWKRGNIPILCGGTGLYARTVVDGIVLPDVKPSPKLRHKLEQQTNEQLFAELKKKDPERAKTIDRFNKRRLVRALEIVEARGEVPRLAGNPIHADVLILGIKKDRAELERRIRARLAKRIKQGMVAEVRRLHAEGISWKRLENFGLEYRHIARFLEATTSKAEMNAAIVHDSLALARRQVQWWKRDPRVVWIERAANALNLAKTFLRN